MHFEGWIFLYCKGEVYFLYCWVYLAIASFVNPSLFFLYHSPESKVSLPVAKNSIQTPMNASHIDCCTREFSRFTTNSKYSAWSVEITGITTQKLASEGVLNRIYTPTFILCQLRAIYSSDYAVSLRYEESFVTTFQE